MKPRKGIIAMCEKPFVGFDIRAECGGVIFAEMCKEAACSSDLCNLFAEGIEKCHALCKLGPMNDDCVNCAYLPQSRGINQVESGFKTALEMIQGIELGRGNAGQRETFEQDISRRKGKKNKKHRPLFTRPAATTRLPPRPVTYRPAKPGAHVTPSPTPKYTTHNFRPTIPGRPGLVIPSIPPKKKKNGKFRPNRQLITR